MTFESTPQPSAVDATPAPVVETVSEIRVAAQRLAARRNELRKPQEEPEPVEAAAPIQESSPEGDEGAAPIEEPTAQTQEANPETESPPLELPRSWSHDKQEHWAKLDRDTQEYLLARDREVTATVRKAQNEAAERQKAIEADQQAMVQARQQYEQALPVLMQTLTATGEFADVRTMDDVRALASNDPIRFAQFQAHQMQLAQLQQEMAQAEQRQQQEYQSNWAKFAQEQDKLYAERFPEIADPQKGKQLTEDALSLLKSVGFSEAELAKAWTGEKISLRDHRIQELITHAARFKKGEAKFKATPPKPAPPAQRPNPAASVDNSAAIKALEQKANKTGNIRDVLALRLARKAAG
jgi:uncharacterized protein YdaT